MLKPKLSRASCNGASRSTTFTVFTLSNVSGTSIVASLKRLDSYRFRWLSITALRRKRSPGRKLREFITVLVDTRSVPVMATSPTTVR